MKRILVLALAVVSVVIHAACSRNERIVIGSKNFTEQVILGELVAQTIERQTHLPVDRRLNLGGTLVCHEAIVAGQLDIYVEYTGTALTAILKEPVSSDASQVYRKVQQLYRERFKAEWTEPLGFNNTFVIVIRQDDAQKLKLKTISDIAPNTKTWKAGFGYEFMDREDGYPGLARLYGFHLPATPQVMDLGLTYKALAAGQVDVIAGNSTDGLIDSLHLFPLEDDKHYFPPYDAVPVVRQEIVEKHPEVRQALAGLGGTVSAQAMRRMNYQVDGEHRNVADVVREFLDKMK